MKDLTDLRKIAEQATDGPWIAHEAGDEPGNWWVWQELKLPYYGGVAEVVGRDPGNICYPEISGGYGDGERERLDATHIATFDPPTVLELLDRAERAEAKLITQTRVLKTIAKRNVSLASDRAKMVWNLEQAEATIQRVREVATEMAGHTMPEGPKGSAWILAEGAQLFAKDVLEALDTTP